MKIQTISKGCGQGKTQQALDLLAQTDERYMLAQPSRILVNQSEADLRGKNANVRAQAITTDNSTGVSQQIRDAMARPMLLAQSPNILLVTHKALLDLKSGDKAKWHLIVDEIPNPTAHLEYKLKLTRRWVVRHLSIKEGIGDSYELTIKPGHVDAVEAMLAGAKDDSMIAVLADLWRYLLHPHYRVYVSKAEWLAKGAKANGQVELNAHAILQPSVFADFASVTIMGANAHDSRLVQVWRNMGVEFVSHASIPDSSHDQATGMRLTVRYLTNKHWTRYLRDVKLKKGVSNLYHKLAGQLPAEYIWSSNNRETHKVEQVLVGGRKLPPVSHGLNAYRRMNTVVSLGSYNDDLAHAKFLSEAFQLSDEDLFRSQAGEMTYQLVMRTSLRVEGEHAPVTAFVPDWRTAEFLVSVLPGCRVEHLDLGIDELKGAKPRFKVATTPAERMAKTREKQAAAVTRSNELMELHRYASGALTGDTPIFATTKAVVATKSVLPLAFDSWDVLYDLLESDRHRKLPKDQAGLIVGSLIDPDAVEETVAGMGNVVYSQFAWMDIDDGDVSPEQASALLGDVKHLIYSSYNNGKVAGKHRYRVVLPFDKPVDPDTYKAVWLVLAARFEKAGYWLPEKAGEEVPTDRPVSGLDYSKCKASDFMYRPVRTADKSKNVWISKWELPILGIDAFANAITDDEEDVIDLWLEERRARIAADEKVFAGQDDLLVMFREQAHAAMKKDAAEKAAEQFSSLPAGQTNQNLYRFAKWLVASGHSADEMLSMMTGWLQVRAGGRDHLRDLKDIYNDAVAGRMRAAR